MPGFWLKRQIMMNLPSEDLEVSVANSIDFMVERVSNFENGHYPSLSRHNSITIILFYANEEYDVHF